MCASCCPHPNVTVGNPWAVSQLASSPPLVIRVPGVSPASAMARSAVSTAGLPSGSRNDSYLSCASNRTLPATPASFFTFPTAFWKAARKASTICCRKRGSWLRAPPAREMRRHDVRRFAPRDDSNVAGPRRGSFDDPSMPSVAHQLGNGHAGNGDGADSLFGMRPGVAGQAVDLDLQLETARRADRRRVGRPAVPIEAQPGSAELLSIDIPRPNSPTSSWTGHRKVSGG